MIGYGFYNWHKAQVVSDRLIELQAIKLEKEMAIETTAAPASAVPGSPE